MHAGGHERAVHAIAGAKLPLSALKLLHILARPHKTPPTVRRVGLMLEVTPERATRLLAQLDEEGLVDRIPDETDGRVKRVLITSKGRRLLDELDAAYLGNIEQFVRTIPLEQRRRLARAIAPIAARPDISELRPKEAK